MGSDGVLSLPGAPRGIPDLGEILTPREKWVPVYHVGPYGCRQIAFYLVRRLSPGESLKSSMVRLPDGSRPQAGSQVMCASCNKEVKAEGTVLALSYDKPPPLELPRKFRTGKQTPKGGTPKPRRKVNGKAQEA